MFCYSSVISLWESVSGGCDDYIAPDEGIIVCEAANDDAIAPVILKRIFFVPDHSDTPVPCKNPFHGQISKKEM